MWTADYREKFKDDGRRYPSDLTDAEWAVIAPLFSVYQPLTADLREMVNACLYLLRTGCGWRYLPTDFGPWETVRTWYDRTDGRPSGQGGRHLHRPTDGGSGQAP
jgi:putative transposase